MEARDRDRPGVRKPLQRYGRVPDRAGPFRGSDSLAGARHGSAPLRAATFSALQPGARVSGKRNVQPRDALLPGSTGNRAALFGGAAGASFHPPHGELKPSSPSSSAPSPEDQPPFTNANRIHDDASSADGFTMRS